MLAGETAELEELFAEVESMVTMSHERPFVWVVSESHQEEWALNVECRDPVLPMAR